MYGVNFKNLIYRLLLITVEHAYCEHRFNKSSDLTRKFLKNGYFNARSYYIKLFYYEHNSDVVTILSCRKSPLFCCQK